MKYNQRNIILIALVLLMLLGCSVQVTTAADEYQFVTQWGTYGIGDQFKFPEGIAIDSAGYVYVADQGNNRIQKVTSTGTFVAAWGSGNGQILTPHGIAVDSAGYVYVTDGPSQIQKFTSSGTFITTWGTYGSGDGQFQNPDGIAVDNAGYVYVADRGNDRIQKFTSTGTFVAKWGSDGEGDGQISSPTGIAVDSTGNVYVVDAGNERIQKFTSTGTFITKWGSLGYGDSVRDGQFNSPEGIAVDNMGNVYVVDTGNERIQKFTSTGTFITKWGSYGSGDGQFKNPEGIAVDSSGNVYVADRSNNRIQKFASTGAFIATWVKTGWGDGQFNGPQGIAVDSVGNVYVADSANNRIQKFTSTGTFIATWGSKGNGDGQFDYPQGVAVDSTGNVYVADYYNNRVQKFTSTGTFVSTWDVGGQPSGIAIDSAGYVYVADWNNIFKFTSTGTLVTTWGTRGSGDGQLEDSQGIAIDNAGYVYVADYGNLRIQKFTSTGTFITKWGSLGSGNEQFYNPSDIAVDGAGNVYVTDDGNNRIKKFTSTGAFVTAWEVINPRGVAFDGAGNVYVIDGNCVKEFAPLTPSATLISSFTAAPTSGTNPLDVQFTDTSTGGASSWSWTFGDGTTSTEKSPVHRYTTAGTYSVSLTIRNAAGLTSTKTQANLISVTAPVSLTANFAASSTSGTAPLAVRFTDQSIGSPTSWSWTFGDGTTSTEQNPSHTYTVAGTYTVSLTARNAAGQSNTKTQTNLISVTTPVIGVPAAEFSATPTLGAGPLTVRFTDTSTGVPTGWYWLFGDGSGSIEQNPSHIYAQAGTYTVQLYAFNAKGYTQKIKTNYITVNTAGALTASFTNTPTSGTAPLDVQFTDTSTGGASSWYWNLGDGTTSTEKSPVHRYTTAGTYAVYLVVTNSLGASDYVYSPQSITVTSPVPLTANFVGTPTSGTAPLAVRFTDQSTGGPNSWSWTFGDGTTSTEQNPSHTYTVAGSYTVSLTARNVGGLTNTKTQANLISVTTPVIGVPAAEFSATPTLGAGPFTVRFTDTSTGVPTGWYWLFGDGSGSIEQNPSHIYAQAGTYTVQLYAFNAKGYTQKIKTNYITVNTAGALTANFTNTPTSGTAPLNVQFTDTSTGGATSWSWNFGDGAASTDQSPSHTYSRAGTYTTSLTIRNSAGLTSIKEGTITVFAAQQALQAAFTVNMQTVIAGQTVVTGTDTSTGFPTTWYWDFGDGFTASTRNFNHFYSQVGSYTLSLTVTSGSQTSTTSKTITVTSGSVIMPVADFTVTPLGGAGSMGILVIDASVNATSVLYDLGDGTTTTYSNFRYTYWQPGTYTIKQTATSATGSSIKTIAVTVPATNPPVSPTVTVTLTPTVSPTGTVSVTPTPTPTDQPQTGAASFTVSPTSGKKSFTAALTDTTTGGTPVSWKWNCGNGQSFSGKSVGLNRIWYNNAGTYTITLTVTDQNGSTRTASKTVTVTS